MTRAQREQEREDLIARSAATLGRQIEAYNASHPDVAAACERGVAEYEARHARYEGASNQDATLEQLYDDDTGREDY